ncbi:NAD(P)/FAD-dependent oxidoreductase [Ectothiorhodospiraceae bacterium WFHF3C12]|nr:NAD(P)/FAD-dependent oxidoreductase [Ectothiorhodospiraceae bacterium WFHF3C12]
MKEQLVVIGNGMAGMRTVEELLKLDRERYEITVFGAEPHVNYNRILLSPVLAGERTLEEIVLNDRDWYADNGISLYTGDPVKHINRRSRVVVAESGMEVPYDRLLLATGSKPFVIPVPGHDLPGVVTFRDIGDVNAMLEASRKYRRAAVIGGGLLGLEAANGLMKQGMDVTVIHLMDSLMERQLDKPAADLLRQSLIERGLDFRMQAQTESILGKRRVEGIRFADGTEIDADLVVMAAGIKPNVDLARDAGLHCERGVVVHDTMQTYDPRIYAVGECLEHRKATYGLVAPIWEQAKVCANHLAQYAIGRYEGSVTSTKLKVTGIDLFSAGDYEGDETTDDIVFQDPRRGVYKRVVVKDNRIQGAVLYGDTADGPWYFDLMKRGEDIDDIRDRLIFGRAYAMNDEPEAEGGRAAAMSDDEQVCDCNGVCKGTIVRAIQEHDLNSRAAVMKQTKAGASCGSCQDLVGEILQLTLGEAEAAPEKPSVCECTELTHEAVREAIREQHLVTPAQVREALDWNNPDGCAKCRPALNYYCISAWPGEAEHDDQSRFINERAHANIQKDGTYSVVPRMFGGVTNPKELRAIADVAEKYDIPTVKVTGGQRIDLLGVKKADLPGVWRDLREKGDLVSGHAYAKALRTVKTCVGKEWCRFGTQDSTTLGIELEKMTWGSWTPHKVKMAVSGCPRNCAEASIKDVGVVCLDSGYEIQVGGNGGVKLRGAEALVRVTTEAEVKEYAAAFMQIYREEARYLERTAHWIDRVGLDYVKQRVVDDAEGRKAAYARFLESQKHSQVDPWEERSRDEGHPEFTPLKEVG